MLGLGSREGRQGSRSGARAQGTTVERLLFGGVHLEILSGHGASCSPGADDRRFAVAPGTASTVAEVACSVCADPTLGRALGPDGNVLGWSREVPGRLALASAGLRVEITALGGRRYAASARAEPGERGAHALLRGVAAAVLEREGGVTLHAAGVELDGRAIVYLGPSGAGKSTAARLTDGGRSFADDHVALVPTESGWMAWGLPGGSPNRMPASAGVVFPIAALLRVRRGRASPRVERLSGTAALFAVREAVESGDCSPEAEAARLSTAARIAREVEVGTIHTVLERPLMREIAMGLGRAREGRANSPRGGVA